MKKILNYSNKLDLKQFCKLNIILIKTLNIWENVYKVVVNLEKAKYLYKNLLFKNV